MFNNNAGWNNPTKDSSNPWYDPGSKGSFDWNKLSQGVGGLGGLFNMFGGGKNSQLPEFNNPANAAMPYLNQIPGMMRGYYSPYINSGNRARNSLEGQYGQTASQLPALMQNYGASAGLTPQLTNQFSAQAGLTPQITEQYNRMMQDPSGTLNQLGKGFQQSPGYDFQKNQMQGAVNRAAAAGGSLGTPSEMQQMAEVTNGLANQDYNNYMNRATGMFGQGLSGLSGLQSQGTQGLSNLQNQGMQGMHNLYNTGMQGQQQLNQMGFQGSNELAQSLANALMSQSNLAYQGQNAQNTNDIMRYMNDKNNDSGQGFGDIFKNLSSLIPLIAQLAPMAL